MIVCQAPLRSTERQGQQSHQSAYREPLIQYSQPLKLLSGAIVSDGQEPFTQPWKENKTTQIDTSTLMEKCTYSWCTLTSTHMIPVVFFLLTVLSALCLFCKRRRLRCVSFQENHLLFISPTTFRNKWKTCSTHIVLYDLFDPSHSEDEDERDQRGVATGRWYIRDLLKRVKRGSTQKSLFLREHGVDWSTQKRPSQLFLH